MTLPPAAPPPATVTVTAQMVASVLAVRVTAGQRVAEGDTLLVVESMKMEIPVTAPVSGVVDELCVHPGDVVEEGDALAVIAEPDQPAGPA